MTELVTGTSSAGLALALVGGVVLGLVFFGGLWWTVDQIARADRSALFFVTSYLMRLTVVAGGFYLVMQGSWERGLACLAGFLFARMVVRWLVEKSDPGERNDAAHS